MSKEILKTSLLLLKISRPLFWFYLAGPYLLGLIFTYKTHHTLQLTNIIFFLFFLFPANFFMYSVNDYFDQDTDKLNPKKRNKETAYPQNLHTLILIINVCILALGFVLSLSLHTLTSRLILAILFMLTYFYSAPPLSFKRVPYLDSLSNIFYVLPAVIPLSEARLNISLPFILASLAWTTAMHLFSAIPDIKYDKKTLIRTTATVLGKQKSLIACFVLWSIFFAITYTLSPLLIISVIYPAIPLLLLISTKCDIEKVYWYFPFFNITIGFFFFLYILFIA